MTPSLTTMIFWGILTIGTFSVVVAGTFKNMGLFVLGAMSCLISLIILVHASLLAHDYKTAAIIALAGITYSFTILPSVRKEIEQALARSFRTSRLR